MVPDIEAAGFTHITLPDLAVEKRSITGAVRNAWRVHKIVCQERVDVIHSFNAQAGLVAVPARIMHRVPLFNTVLGNGREKMLRYVPFKLVAVSQSVAEKLRAFGVPGTKIKVIYNATLDDRFVLSDKAAFDTLQSARAKITPFTLISVAVMMGQKGHAGTLEALAAYRTRADAQPLHMVFVGDGPKLDAIKYYATKLGLGNMVHFEGASNQVDMDLDRAHAFIYLPELETFGIVLAEANARGLPIVAANVGGIPEVLADGQTGIMVEHNNVQNVADAIARLVNDPDLAARYGWAGAQRAANMFRAQNMASDCAPYTKILGRATNQ